MRIAYVCADPGVPIFGSKGCSIHVQEMLRALRSAGADLSVVAARSGGVTPPEFGRLRLESGWLAGSRSAAERERCLLAANASVARALARLEPVDLVYERYALFAHAGMEYARRRGVPGLLEVNAPLLEEQRIHRALVDGAAAQAATRRAFAAASELRAVSDEVASWLERFPEARGRIRVVPNAVDLQRFRPDVRAEQPDARFTVGFVGSLKPWHGVDGLLSAFARLRTARPRVRLLLVGDGPERGALERRCAALKLGDAVVFSGAVAPTRIPGLLTSMDVAAAPYPSCDGFYFSPLKLYEYLAAGLPVVASRAGEIARSVEHGVDGWLCEPGDVAALQAALVRLHDDGPLRARLGREARRRAELRGDWSGGAAAIVARGSAGGAAVVRPVAAAGLG